MAALTLVRLSAQLDQLYHQSSKDQLTTVSMITAAVACVAGVTVMARLTRPAIIRYFRGR